MSRLFACLVVIAGVAGCASSINENGTADAAAPDAPPPIDAAPSTFNVASAVSADNTHVSVTFDAAPNVGQATTLSSYSIPNLTLAGVPTLSGNTATIETGAQSATSYTVTVAGVQRASDQAKLTIPTATFTGHTAFDVTAAASPGPRTITVTFDAPPNASQAATLANYTIAGLALSGTPALAGSTVTLTTADQTAVNYTVVVANVTRASDAEPLSVDSARVLGTPVLPPTVTNVVVASTLPDNGAVPFNTGTATLTITGTEFDTVTCPAGVVLDDLDGAGSAVGTHPTACTVDSDTQITATFPANIRTNGSTGWNVRVTNDVSANTTSTVRFVPRAGLLISEVYTGTAGATDHEFVEVYNPTAAAIARTGLHLHIRSSSGSEADKTLTQVTTTAIPAHGFLLFASAASAAPDAWFAHEDITYSDALVANGGVYLSMSGSANVDVLDRVGWGTQPAPGFEGSAAPNIGTGVSAERKPASGIGATTDTDNNATDFNAPSATITPLGTVDGIQPGPTFNVMGAVATGHASVAVTFDAPPDPAAAVVATNYTITGGAGVTVSAATLAGNTVTLTTSTQAAITYTVTVANVTRGLDAKPLTTATATFTGHAPFNVASAASTSSESITVTFSDAPDPVAAVVLANYAISPTLTLSGTPTLSGNTVTLVTSVQTATAFTVTVTGVTRAADAEPLTTASAAFTGTAVKVATVSAIAIGANSADAGTTPYNTGTTSVTLTGTDFNTVTCPTGVTLDALDGSGNAATTTVTNCTVVSDTSITLTFPAGIRTNGTTGWNVLVTNNAGTNTTSAAKFVPRAGLLISEVMLRTAGSADDEFVELYNPTAATYNALPTGPTPIFLHIHTSGTSESNKTLTAVTTAMIPSHGFLLISSSAAVTADESWAGNADLTYSAALAADGGAYISLSSIAEASVLDKVGWGAAPAVACEGTAAAPDATSPLASGDSIQRLPAAGAGDATDTDDNLADFTLPAAFAAPFGTSAPPQP